uniref:WGS project CBMI000000000 data, contig CS3069_c003094 n=1 Tax=Fusarium clavum TaxID=2594811 RepID=A0A090MJE4_9HYPO|nr:unnamed protein product [Fusarium clavum]
MKFSLKIVTLALAASVTAHPPNDKKPSSTTIVAPPPSTTTAPSWLSSWFSKDSNPCLGNLNNCLNGTSTVNSSNLAACASSYTAYVL